MNKGQCKICVHPERDTIERMITAGLMSPEIMARFKRPDGKPMFVARTIARHRDGHMRLGTGLKAAEARVMADIKMPRLAPDSPDDIIRFGLDSLWDSMQRLNRLASATGALRAEENIREGAKTLLQYGEYLKSKETPVDGDLVFRIIRAFPGDTVDTGTPENPKEPYEAIAEHP